MGDVEEERYSTPYVVKNALGATVVNNKKLIVQIERKAKGLTSAFIRISRFLNLFVLRCLENTKYIPRLNNSCIQYVCNAVFGKYKNSKNKKRDMLNKIANMDD
jgi:hypothetical protein